MHRLLKLHPDSKRFATTVEVEIKRPRPDSLAFRYRVTGMMSNVRLSPIADVSRTDDLWQHTCFEAFIRASSGAEYYEFNFAPSAQWAAYHFSGYRSGMRVADEISTPPMEVRSSLDSYSLQTSLELGRLSALPRNVSWRLGLSAVLEDVGGNKSYWALAHPPGKPDFHQADCFAYEFFPGV
jgi:hypothetical protein